MAEKPKNSDNKNKAVSADMSDNNTPSLDQPSDEAIAIAYKMTMGPGLDEINQKTESNKFNSDEEAGQEEELEFSDSELPSREGINKKKKKKKSSSSKSSTEGQR